MKCIFCGSEFQPEPPRRRVCPVCVKARRVKRSQNLQTQKEKPASRKPFFFVSVGSERNSAAAAGSRRETAGNFPGFPGSSRPNLFQLECDRIWRELNVIPFPLERRCKPPTTPPTPFNGDSAA